MCLIAGVDQCICQHIGWVLNDILIDILAECRLTYWSICLLSLVEDTSRIGRALVLYWSSIDRHIDRSLVNRWSTVGRDSIDSVSAMHRRTIGQVSVTYQWCLEWRDKPCILSPKKKNYCPKWERQRRLSTFQAQAFWSCSTRPPHFFPKYMFCLQQNAIVFSEKISLLCPTKLIIYYYAETFSLWTDGGQGLVLTACWWYVSEQLAK